MTHTSPPTFLGLPIEAKRRVDGACLAFERAGSGERIEDYLPRVGPELRGVLLTELLALELEWRRAAGESPLVADYLSRFPADGAAVRAAFKESVPAVGDALGKYRLTGVLGRGGMGVVFDALDTVIDRKVAIKVLPDRLASDPLARERLVGEARMAGQLLHPNVVALFEAGEAGGVTFLVLERVSGGSASDRIKQGGALDWRLATRVAADACRGLAAIHGAGFLHLDIKPGNILLPRPAAEPSGPAAGGVLAKLTDFSLSATSASVPGIGATGGTPAYMSPEQRDGGELTRRTDVFGLGAAYFALLTGEAPYPGATVTEVAVEQIRRPDPDPRAVNPAVPEAVARVVRRAMAPRPADRYPSAEAVLADLESLLAPPRARRWREAAAAVVGAALMLAVAGGISLLLSSPQGGGPPRQPRAPFPPFDTWEPLLDDHDLGGWRPVVAEGGTPIGEGPPSEFSLVSIDGSPALRATGTGLGGVESSREFENYHLRFEYRWASAHGDHYASLRYHCTGPLGSKGTHGMQLHLQRAGSYIRNNGLLRIDIGELRGGVIPARPGGRRIDPAVNAEAPVGRWNTAALVCVGDSSLHVINGTPVLALARSRRAEPPDEPLTRGRIRFQAIKGEVFFRKIEIRKATEIPPEYLPRLEE